MKKIILPLALLFTFSACKKECSSNKATLTIKNSKAFTVTVADNNGQEITQIAAGQTYTQQIAIGCQTYYLDSYRLDICPNACEVKSFTY